MVVRCPSKNIIVAPKKFIKKSTQRNLFKRRIRFLIRTFYQAKSLTYINFKIFCKEINKYKFDEYMQIIDIIHKNAVRIYKLRKSK